MDVELQILKHLPRSPEKTAAVVDQYCESYKEIFGEVRSYEYFKYLHIGIISPIKKKSFPEIAKAVGINSPQSLHHFIANSPWSVGELRNLRLRKTREALKDDKITVIIDEIGDKKKGKKTDYVARQYLGSVGKIDRGIVAVNAYGVYKNITFPLLCKVFKPQGTLKEGDIYRSKLEIASQMIDELRNYGLNIELVLADICPREGGTFVSKLEDYNLCYLLFMRSDRAALIPSHEKVRENKWYKFSRFLGDPTAEKRYVREIIFDRRRAQTYWQLTTDISTLPENSTFWMITNIQETRNQMKKSISNLYSLTNWSEYGFRKCTQELGWADYRLTQYVQIEKWWEMILSAYLMISLNSQPFLSLKSLALQNAESSKAQMDDSEASQSHHSGEWKSVLNTLRLLIQPILQGDQTAQR
ncbi:IS701 family transposase [Roseofilum reptotaenium CS-1145]|uniref:IS701 family transposase n=1 Tax=Roseofilum reptotaenium AO1-A TaxID=1925591 RepID=A0A1L9QNF9_9CYAN|nr:IS701 family transposase [Roseofilum reptotaenium]MDB9517073.1 IS701 family transposase [Roseofilum reptotaenium CS-1145]OJJ24182.1 IS701 family transposase [Roseofilum reptotaenium AO1-A]